MTQCQTRGRDPAWPGRAARYVVLITLGAGTISAGCSSNPVEIKGDPGGAELAKVGVAYARATEGLGRPPQNLDELKRFLKREDGDADALLRSPNDGLPFEIIWGVDIFTAPPDAAAPAVVAYERRGANGKRYVLTVGVAVLSLTDKEFAKAQFPKGHKPPP